MSDTQPMMIECIARRAGGSLITMGGTKYHFTPDEKGRHVAAVEDPDHIGRFLGITEGFRIPRDTGTDGQSAIPASRRDRRGEGGEPDCRNSQGREAG